MNDCFFEQMLMENVIMGLRYYVQFNDFNQPLRKGGSILVSFLGDVAKRETFCPVGVSNWHKLKKKMKADIVILVR
ncbi:FACT complex subunit SPT16, partial [Bienertia sinuspersici]